MTLAPEPEHRLESEASPAAQSPAAVHDDALSPAQALRQSINATGSQRVGDSPPVANPLATFPDAPAEGP